MMYSFKKETAHMLQNVSMRDCVNTFAKGFIVVFSFFMVLYLSEPKKTYYLNLKITPQNW